MPTKLRKLKITRVAVCPQGANYDTESGEGAHILLFKHQPPLVVPEPPEVIMRPSGPGGVERPTLIKGPIGAMGAHAEPDGDEVLPLDYATRGQQYDLWEQLWGKWEQFCATFYDVVADGDEDNIPNLPILERSIGQFQTDVQALLSACGVLEKTAPVFASLDEVLKAGAAMAGHRLSRLKAAITQLQQILDECTPAPIDRPGLSAAEVVPASGYGVSHVPYLMKGRPPMAVRKNAESDKEHCDACDDKDCDNGAHERMKNMNKQDDARVQELETALATAQSALTKAQTDLAQAQHELSARDTTIAKMKQTPEEQEAEYWAGVPEVVRKRHEADALEKEDLRKQLDDARAEREQTVYIAKTADFRHFGMVQKHWKILKAIDRMEDEDKEELLRLMKAAQEQTRTAGLFSVAGTEGRNGSGGLESGSASDQIMAMTKAYEEEKGVSFAKASEHIAKAHPELYQRMTQERRRAARVSAE